MDQVSDEQRDIVPAQPSGAHRIPALHKLIAALGAQWQHGRLALTAPEGSRYEIEGTEPGPSGNLILRDLRTLGRLLWSGDIGFAEGYMAGEWDTPDLPALLHAVALNMGGIDRLLSGTWSARLVNALQHLRNRNSRSGSKRNIAAHYDLGNSFYERWLDKSMTYSSALHDAPGMSLFDAQQRKYRALAERIALKAGHSVLEIGCGWGGFAEFAAREIGARVTAITISPAQHAYASARMQNAGLNERVTVRLTDYRDVEGVFDRAVSIEMLEAVGESYWPVYFRKIRDALTRDGVFGLQTIVIDDPYFAEYRRRVDFIQRYIFPGGLLPAEFRLRELGETAGLSWKGALRFGNDYARTLGEWSQRFGAEWSEIRKLGFDERFRRLWLYYLAYCEAGFRSGRIDVIQLALQKV